MVRLQAVRELDAQLARERIERAQGSCSFEHNVDNELGSAMKITIHPVFRLVRLPNHIQRGATNSLRRRGRPKQTQAVEQGVCCLFCTSYHIKIQENAVVLLVQVPCPPRGTAAMRSVPSPLPSLPIMPPSLTGREDDGVHLLVDLRETCAGTLAPEAQVRLHRRDGSRSSSAPPSPPPRRHRLPRSPFSQHHHLVVLHVLHAVGQQEPENLDKRRRNVYRPAAENIPVVALTGRRLIFILQAEQRGGRGGV